MPSFEEQLALSAPPVPLGSDDLDRELLLVIARAEDLAASARSRPRGRLVGGILAVVGVITAGAGAASAGILPWFDTAPSRDVVMTSSGNECKIAFGVKPLEDPARPVAPGPRAAAVKAAESFLRTFDVSSIDIAEATRGLPARATIDSESGPAQSVTEYETGAVNRVVQQRVAVALEQQHLPVAAVSVSMATSCDSDAP